MTLSRLNAILCVLVVIAAAFAVATDVDYTRPNVEFLPEMKRTPASDAYAASPVHANGRTMQAPVAGTIARGDLPLYYSATKEDAERAGEELQNPFTHGDDEIEAPPSEVAFIDADAPRNEAEVDAESPSQETAEGPKPEAAAPEPAAPDPLARLNASIQRGSRIYGTFCVCCHGPSGAGDGLVAKRGFPPPPSLTTGKSTQMKDGQLFHILTYGQGSMSPMKAQLSRDRRWDVINYVRSVQQAAQQTPTAAQTAESQTPETGDQPSETEEGPP